MTKQANQIDCRALLFLLCVLPQAMAIPICADNPFANYPSYQSSHFSLAYPNSEGDDHATRYCDWPGEVTFTSTPDMFRACQDFCPNASFPVLLGSSTFGLNFEAASGAISELMGSPDALTQFPWDQYLQCRQDKEAFYDIQMLAADFAKQQNEFEYAVLLFRHSIENVIIKSKQQLSAQSTADAIQRASDNEKIIKVIVDLYESALAESGSARNELKEKLEQMTDSKSNLVSQLLKNIQEMKSFMASCTSSTRLWPAPTFNVLEDMCTHRGTKCFEYKNAQHVSCGCLVDLSADVGTKESPALKAAVNWEAVAELRATSRHLSPSALEYIDICAEGKVLSDTYAKFVIAQLPEDSNILQAREADMKHEYGAFYCKESPVQSKDSARSRLHENMLLKKSQNSSQTTIMRRGLDASPSSPTPSPSSPTPSPSSPAATPSPSHTHTEINGSPPCAAHPFKDNGYPSFLTLARDGTVAAGTPFCDYGGSDRYKTMESMVDRCTEFCPHSSIPALIGSPTFGLNFDQSTGILSALMGTDLNSFSKDDLETCLEQRNAFATIQELFSNVLKHIIEFNAAVISYRSAIMAAVKTVTPKLDSKAVQDDIQDATGPAETIKVIMQLYGRIINSPEMASERTELSKKLNETEQAIISFDTKLTSAMSSFESFVTNCSGRLFPPTNGQVMLDMCTIKGTKCVDKDMDDVEHVTCGCLVNLAVNVGVLPDARGATLHLKAVAKKSAPVKLDVCSKARMDASSYLQGVSTKLKHRGSSDLIQHDIDRNQAQYGSQYCSPWTKSSSSPKSKQNSWHIIAHLILLSLFVIYL